MPSLPPTEKEALLREAIALFTDELATLYNHRYEDVPELKKKKAKLAARFRQIDWHAGDPTPLPPEFATVQALIAELEAQSRQEIRGELDLIGKQIAALHELRQYWQESLSVSFQRFYAPAPAT